MSKAFVAIDLGAESGRVVALLLQNNGQRFELHEAHRFPTRAVRLPSGLHWDIVGIWRELISGLMLVAGWAEEQGHEVCSLGVDTWGVDWALVDARGELLGLPHAYRDPRNQAAFEKVTARISQQEIYGITGIQIMPINSLYSLFALSHHSPGLLAAADRFLFIPDLLHFYLSGKTVNEATIASTSQLLEIDTGQWSQKLLEICGAPGDLFGQPVPPGTPIGKLRKRVVAETGLHAGVQVVAPPSHDTASAVAAVPARADSRWCFISSGTWSLVGAEIAEPCVTEEAARAMFTNEAGVAGTTRFLKNIAGLWLVQQCRRAFASRGQSYGYDELTDIAKLAEPFRTLVDPDHGPFAAPGKMLDKMNDYASDTRQPIPETPGDYLRSCLESLALAYRQTIESLEAVLNREFDTIHIVGGGGQNELLNQMTADACGKPVVVGPIEATAIGNGLMQAVALQEVADLQQLRQIVANTIEPRCFQPQDTAPWNEVYQMFCRLPGRSLPVDD
jgi:rhamnulokinase